jgi:Xaa-Pro dipeptidase
MAEPEYLDHLSVLDARFTAALEAAGFDGVIIDAGVPRNYFLDDQSPAWHPNPHFTQWLPGALCPRSSLLVRPGERPRLYFHGPADYWHQPPEAPAWVGDAMEILVFGDADELDRALAAAAAGSNRMARIAETPTGSDRSGISDNPAGLLARLHFDRAVKTPFEICCMAAATERAVRGHRAAAAAFAAGASEFEIHLGYLAAAGQTSEELPYPSIVAQNAHAGLLHYQHYDREPPSLRRSFLIDAGASFRGYAADITRTYAVAEAPDGVLFAGLVAALDDAQRELVAAIRPGLDYVDLHVSAHRAIARVLAEHRIVTCSPEAAFDAGITRSFLPHGLGHLLGLQTHDVGGLQADPQGTPRPAPAEYPALRLTRPIDVGQVFTIEPGLYFIPLLLDELRGSSAAGSVDWGLVERLLPFGGIRIEDNVLVTAEGVRNLTRDAFAAATASPTSASHPSAIDHE